MDSMERVSGDDEDGAVGSCCGGALFGSDAVMVPSFLFCLALDLRLMLKKYKFHIFISKIFTEL